jgi:hypothetical protein
MAGNEIGQENRNSVSDYSAYLSQLFTVSKSVAKQYGKYRDLSSCVHLAYLLTDNGHQGLVRRSEEPYN